MNILLIQSGTSKELQKAMGEGNMKRINMPMLGLLYIESVIPKDRGYHIEVLDENHSPVTEYHKYDIVGISGMTMHAGRMYELADNYRNLGCYVVLGGVHVSFMIEEALQHADSVMVQEGELSWPVFLEDFEQGDPQKVYYPPQEYDIRQLSVPNRKLVDGPAYKAPAGTLNSIIATRGCPGRCRFCCVRKMFDGSFRTRTVDHVIAELNALDDNIIIFQDDNLVGNFRFAEELFAKMLPLNRKWGAQASINIANNDELLSVMAESGCSTLFIGFESVNARNIASITKSGVNKTEAYSDQIKKIHDKGIKIFGSFIVGFDDDEDSVFDDIYEFCEKNKIDFPIVNCLTPFPGTELYEQFNEEGRIIDRNWENYNLTKVVIRPKNMKPEELQFKYNALNHYLNKMTYGSIKTLMH